ncbi:PAS domain S-box-containing protein [Geoalkalibacter ferrihydriticus]|uniref:histidine kinase n=2 Tax=Geoalkalibacter ferrihydriticus TaxID=392333 RepID=A0A0C2HKD0_9BACT|nr:DUF3365 domain-containing protein [Geoalkalibacter ferrihydriticus]KIH77526.1 hypothetical protein GFER_02165 [Geoalkalibacter ferrihydriticus DSM 17813]SDL66147.1 PAS domain S-box-containing protein [Geoalkalibacter ferrihydriticus]
MNFFRNLGLLAKISVIVVAILTLFLGFNALLNYHQQKNIILDEALMKARGAAYHAVQAREYLSAQYLAGQVELSKERYGLIPVVASNRIGLLVAQDLDYHIRQTSDRYRNPDNAPDPFEAAALKTFREEQSMLEYFEETTLDGEPMFRYMLPFSADESCLQCHGDPAEAPAYIQELFPRETDQAYNYELGEIIGAASISIPMEDLYRQIYANLRFDLLATGGTFLALITCLGFLIRHTVTRPLSQLGGAIGEIMRTGRFEEQLPGRGRDEIGHLIEVFNEMTAHLREKTGALEESERRFRLLTENARDGIISFLANGQIILFNRQAEKIFGFSKREAIGMNISELIHPDCPSIHQIGAQEYFRIHSAELMKEIRRIPGRRRDGSAMSMELALSLTESDGHIFYTAIVRV